MGSSTARFLSFLIYNGVQYRLKITRSVKIMECLQKHRLGNATLLLTPESGLDYDQELVNWDMRSSTLTS